MADVLIFSPHPDDAEFGMGGTILKMAEEGKSVVVCVLTKGQAGSYGSEEDRIKEMKAASEYAGFELEMLDFEDCKVFDNFESRKALAEVIRKHKPKTIFTPYHTNHGEHKNGMAHPDHTVTGNITRVASRYSKFEGLEGIEGEAHSAEKLVYYMVPFNLKPSFIVDVSDKIENLKELIKCHQTQNQIRHGTFMNILLNIRKIPGIFQGAEYAEAFYTEESLNMDVNNL